MMFHGLAVVSADFFLAQHKNHLASEWASAEDFRHLQEALDKAHGCVMGRVTHDLHPNIKKRRRIVLTRSIAAECITNHHTLFINPLEHDKTDFLEKIGNHSGGDRLCILGGADIYRFWLENHGYTGFDLTIEHNIMFGTGIALFQCREGNATDPRDAFGSCGMSLASTRPLNDRGTVLYRLGQPLP
ncbi:MAG: dihydrofolate reductase [Alphaproteobacteria bacterium]|nr:MAG: dihydrofolate reductase [Alphaproteobacteria bacterium]